MNLLGGFDVAVIGGGHAGLEAAMASAKLGMKTALFTMSLDSIANMPCNPSIGGTAKGHLVREIDALGGHMGRLADHATIQSRMLNMSKGPAVNSLRAQVDRRKYQSAAKSLLENQANLYIRQCEITDIILDNKGNVSRLAAREGGLFEVKAVIIASGTYLNSRIHIGESQLDQAADGSVTASALTDSLCRMGIKTRRFKTGTPARAHRRSIDFSKLDRQPGDEPVKPFSFDTTEPILNRAECHIAYTNADTHAIITANLHRSPIYSGKIDAIGARYCPSIEDKVVRFADKSRHQIFVEPMGLDTDEIYLQGMSSSMPEDVQIDFLRTIQGFENIEIMRSAYAIEYDCCDPSQLRHTLEFKTVGGLYGAGQFNGTSGYEEAAAQGLAAGINAALKLQNRPPFVLERWSSYIGTLIDDLVIKGCQDPYRMMTSRSEYRLLLRQDNADARLTPRGYEIGLISDQRMERLEKKLSDIKSETDRLSTLTISPSAELNAMLESKGTTPIAAGAKAADLLKRPEITYADLAPFDRDRIDLAPGAAEEAVTEIKYAGYIKRQASKAEELKRLESRVLDKNTDYTLIKGLRLEAIEKLSRIRPDTIGQASRISGVTPADITVLLIWMRIK
ncbi:MAG: tRNA uridine-5-carboxymethylaminomethyl(34) synthesis enzyme MnmG [Oscillospiraceae bacterium]|nr:tRNA uridine-5-carboxymethylaminomethyl(34) synthesis enzyme MnmG [Oscillospiraceae bacterium]